MKRLFEINQLLKDMKGWHRRQWRTAGCPMDLETIREIASRKRTMAEYLRNIGEPWRPYENIEKHFTSSETTDNG